MATLLVDMDGVLSDFERSLIRFIRAEFPEALSYIDLANRTTFFLDDEFPVQYRHSVRGIMNRPGYFMNLHPIEGGIETLDRLTRNPFKNKVDVWICTSPLLSNPHCVQEKYAWVRRHLGHYWEKRVIITTDKTLVYGDYLIDDRPEIPGKITPVWQHILYTQPCNIKLDKPRITWGSCQWLLEELLS